MKKQQSPEPICVYDAIVEASLNKVDKALRLLWQALVITIVFAVSFWINSFN